ncbi:MAG: hypothetical protein MK538_17600, partial [Planctomycetes bacterium]|nr:hypothetical protein [Planctomycetota bacterium]
HHHGDWHFLNGNEIGAILTEYVVRKRLNGLDQRGVIIKTAVTTDLIRAICEKHDVELIGDLLVGYKYIAHEMNILEKAGRIDAFLFGCEESHGYNAGNYAREKDAVVAALWLSELAAELKQQEKTLVDHLNETYSIYGYFRNYLTEVRSPGAEGTARIEQIQQSLRDRGSQPFGRFEVAKAEDYRDKKPIVSSTDLVSKNVLRFHLKPVDGTTAILVTVRPSGTEPKIKMYFEIGSNPFPVEEIERVQAQVEDIRQELEKAFMDECYRAIGVEFPERGYLLFWQLPLDAKLNYFDIEPKIADLKNEEEAEYRRSQLFRLVKFLGSDPIEKIDRAFQAKYESPVLRYLGLER